MPFFFLLPPVKQRRGSRAPAALGHGGTGSRGKRGRTTWGSRPPPRFGSEHGEAAAPRRPVGGGRQRSDGGAVERGGGQEVGEMERGVRGFGCTT